MRAPIAGRRVSTPAVAVALVALFSGWDPERASWKLVDHFRFARTAVEPTLIDIGAPESRPLLVSGWSHDEGTGEGSFVWGVGAKSVLEFFLHERRALVLTVRWWPFVFADAPPQSVTFVLNGVPGPELVLGSESTTYQVALPPKAAKGGWNRLVMRYAHAHAPRDVVGTVDPRPLAVAFDFVRFGPGDGSIARHATAAPSRRVMTIPGGAVVSHYVHLPEDVALRFDDVAFSGDSVAHLVVRLEGDQVAETIARVGRADAVRTIVIPPGWANIARLSLSLDGPPGTSVDLVEPRLERPIVRGARRTCDVTPARRPHVVVYLVDTLRADALGCYGHDRPTSPHLDRFMQDAVQFADAVAEAPWTRASVASLFTGLPPRVHGVNGRTDALPEEAVTLAERLGRAGYETAEALGYVH